MLVKIVKFQLIGMRFDIHRLRASGTLSDPDAFKYSREAAISSNPKLIHNRFYQSNRKSNFLRNRPVPIALGLIFAGLTVSYYFVVSSKPPEKNIIVQQTVDRLKRDLDAYEAYLKT